MDQIRLVFLGTGAAAPTRQRNVSSVAAVLDGRVLLFDCGEGTQHQLMRSSVRSGAIEAVFITHLHGDHIFGLPGLIATLGLNARTAPLTIYGPAGLSSFLDAIPYPGTTYDIEVVEIDCDDTKPVEIRNADGYRIFAALLEHSVPCFGYSIVEDDRPGAFDVETARSLGVPEGPLFGRLQRGHDVTVDGRVIRSREVVGLRRPGRRIAFCTDTRPCNAAADLGRDSDLFIHEATYANDHAREAVERFHSTAEEAARVARQAAPQRLILTHVSARYEEDGPLLADARPLFAATEVAHDLLDITVPRRE
jgi:ribonuclease Z